MTTRKGIVLAGGSGSRLFPVTNAISKQMIPIYDKPMIYYPLSTLMLADIRDIIVISSPRDLSSYQRLLGDGSQFGINIIYIPQPSPEGIAQAFHLSKEHIQDQPSALILGDNIFYGHDLYHLLSNASKFEYGASVFAYKVSDPSRYGVVDFDRNNNVKSIQEKPKYPLSNYALTGLYFYDSDAYNYAVSLKPSARGELEITDLNNLYLKENKLRVEVMRRGITWLDTGTPQSLLEASNFIATVQRRQGLVISCLEEIAYRKRWITLNEMEDSIQSIPNCEYKAYILDFLAEQI